MLPYGRPTGKCLKSGYSPSKTASKKKKENSNL